MLYCIIADETFDQVCETELDAKREAKDLRELGYKVKIVRVNTWEDAYSLEDDCQ